QIEVVLIFANEPSREKVQAVDADNVKFRIPAEDPRARVDSELELHQDVRLIAMLPHIHLRGRDFKMRVEYPDGRTETVLRVPRYDFNWQLVDYPVQERLLPKGTRIRCTAHYDNSPDNPNNPDAWRTVTWGEQSWDEMIGDLN